MAMLVLKKIKEGKYILSFLGLRTTKQAFEFIIPLVIARFFNPETFASFSLLKMVIFFGAAIFIGPLLTPFIIESVKEYKQDKKANKTFTSVMIFTGSSMLLIVLLFLFFGHELMAFTGLDYDIYHNVFILAFLGLSLTRLCSALLISQNRKSQSALVELSYYFLIVVYILTLRQFGVLNLYQIVLSYFIIAVAVLVFTFFLIDFRRLFPLNISKENLKTITSFASWTILGYLATYLINWGDNLILKYFTTLKDIGIYNLAYQIFKGGVMISLALNTYFTPFVSRFIEDKQKMRKLLTIKRKYILTTAYICIGLGVLFVKPLINFIFGESYADSGNVVLVLFIALAAAFYYSLHIAIFNVYGEYRFVQKIIIAQVFLNILFDIIFVPIFGILGAAIGTAIAYLLFTFILFWKYNRVIKPNIL